MIIQDWDVDGVDLQDFLDIKKDELKGRGGPWCKVDLKTDPSKPN